jgi:ferredoxin
MMGQVTNDFDTPVTKTSTGVVVLPQNHIVSQRRLLSRQNMAKIGKSACDQCRYCTELCPRFLLGYQVEPIKLCEVLLQPLQVKRIGINLPLYVAVVVYAPYFPVLKGFTQETCDNAKRPDKKNRSKTVV